MKKKEIIRFVVVGCTATSADFIIYYLLKESLSPSFAKAISFITGTLITYLLSKYWTFEAKEKSAKEAFKFFSLYATTLGLNVSINKLTLLIFPEWYFFAFLCSTGAGMVVNFIGQKWWVFRSVNSTNG